MSPPSAMGQHQWFQLDLLISVTIRISWCIGRNADLRCLYGGGDRKPLSRLPIEYGDSEAAERLGQQSLDISVRNDDLAARLVVSPRTVHAHLRSIFRKLDVSSRTAALREARRLGMRI